MSRRLGDIPRRLWSDQRGQTTIEYALLLAFIGLPAYAAFALLLSVLAETYRMVVFLELLPFP
jgi:Flp pilus assembly pilin Flp